MEKIRNIIWMQLKHEQTGEIITISYEESEDENFVPDDYWAIMDMKLVRMKS